MSRQHIVMTSAGGGSWAAGKRVVERHGPENVKLLFTDTLSEDEDAYRFLVEGAANVLGVEVPSQRIPKIGQFPPYEDRAEYKLFVDGLRREFVDVVPRLIWIARGGDIWDTFFEQRFLGNSSADPCSKRLKREFADAWLRANCDPANTTVYVGLDWTEPHRFDDGEGHGVRPRRAADGWLYEAPMMDAPYLWPRDVQAWMRREGIEPPRLYGMGFPHNNCGGFCIKAGHAQMGHLLRTLPRRFNLHEGMEQDFIRFIGSNVSILTDRSGDGEKKPLTLRGLRERIEKTPQAQLDLGEWRSCGCFLDDAA